MNNRITTYYKGGIYIPMWIQRDPALTSAQAAVYAMIVLCSEGGNDYHGTLRHLCHCANIRTESHASTILRQLLTMGYITKQTELLLRGRRINHYRMVPVEFLDDCHETKDPLSSNDSREIHREIITPVSPFVPPSEDEVRAYCQERGNTIDPALFISSYQSTGWRVGHKPMKDWRAAIRTWERRQKINNHPSSIKNHHSKFKIHSSHGKPRATVASIKKEH